MALLLESRHVARELVFRFRRVIELTRGVADELFHARQHFFGARDLLGAFIELGDLRVHGPHHLIQAVRLDDSVVDGVLLAFERLRFMRDVFSQRVEGRQAFFGVLALGNDPGQEDVGNQIDFAVAPQTL